MSLRLVFLALVLVVLNACGGPARSGRDPSLPVGVLPRDERTPPDEKRRLISQYNCGVVALEPMTSGPVKARVVLDDRSGWLKEAACVDGIRLKLSDSPMELSLAQDDKDASHLLFVRGVRHDVDGAMLLGIAYYLVSSSGEVVAARSWFGRRNYDRLPEGSGYLTAVADGARRETDRLIAQTASKDHQKLCIGNVGEAEVLRPNALFFTHAMAIRGMTEAPIRTHTFAEKKFAPPRLRQAIAAFVKAHEVDEHRCTESLDLRPSTADVRQWDGLRELR